MTFYTGTCLSSLISGAQKMSRRRRRRASNEFTSKSCNSARARATPPSNLIPTPFCSLSLSVSPGKTVPLCSPAINRAVKRASPETLVVFKLKRKFPLIHFSFGSNYDTLKSCRNDVVDIFSSGKTNVSSSIENYPIRLSVKFGRY